MQVARSQARRNSKNITSVEVVVLVARFGFPMKKARDFKKWSDDNDLRLNMMEATCKTLFDNV